MKKTLILFLMCFGLCASAHADRWICAGGSGNGSGDSAANCANGNTESEWQEAYDAVSCGDSIHINRGDTFTFDPQSNTYLVVTDKSCTSGNELTITAYGSGNRPKLVGDRDTNQGDPWERGEGVFRLDQGTDYHIIENMDFELFRVPFYTGNRSTLDGVSASNVESSVTGQIDNNIFQDIDITAVDYGFLFSGTTHAICSDGCVPSDVDSTYSDGNTIRRVNVLGASTTGIMLIGGTQNTTITDFDFDGGGATYDVSTAGCSIGECRGQHGIDVGRTSGGRISSGNNNYTPDQNVTITNFTCTDANNRGAGAGERDGDCLKTEKLSTGTWTGGFAKLCSESGVDSKGDWTITNVVLANNSVNLKSYSGNIASETETSSYVTKCVNCLLHSNRSRGGNQQTRMIHNFGMMELENTTIWNPAESTPSIFNFNDEFADPASTIGITITDTIYAIDENASNDIKLVDGSLDIGSPIDYFTDNNSYNYCYDNIGTTDMCNGGAGTDPGFSDPDVLYDSINFDGTGFDSQTHGPTVGWLFGGLIPTPDPTDTDAISIRNALIRNIKVS